MATVKYGQEKTLPGAGAWAGAWAGASYLKALMQPRCAEVFAAWNRGF